MKKVSKKKCVLSKLEENGKYNFINNVLNKFNKSIKNSRLKFLILLFFINVLNVVISHFLHNNFMNICFSFVFWCSCLFFIYYIISYTIRFCKIKLDKSFWIYSSVMLIIVFVVYAISMYNTKQIYTWDQVNYYSRQIDLISKFDNYFSSGIRDIIVTSFDENYGHFLLSFTSFPFKLTNQTIYSFIIVYGIFCVIPACFIIFLNAKNLCDKYLKSKNKLFFLIVSLIISFFPLLHKAALIGQPDIFGIFWIGIVSLILSNIDYQKVDYPSAIFCGIMCFLAIITRRWYLFWVVAYIACYIIVNLVNIYFNKRKQLKKMFFNYFKYFFVMAVCICFLISPILYRTFVNNYGSSYQVWNLGGLSFEFKNQIYRLGYFYCVFIVFGFVYGIIKKEIRSYSLIFVLSLLLSIVLFTRIQNTSYHQSLIFVFNYSIGIIMFLLFVCNIKNKCLKIFLSSLVIIIVMINTISSFTEKMCFKNDLFSNISLKPIVRSDYEVIGEMDKFFLQNLKDEDMVYGNFANGQYNFNTFNTYYFPDTTLKNKFYYESSIDSIHGFPIGIFNARYVIIANQVIDGTGATPSRIIPIINNAFNEDKILKKFDFIRTYKMDQDLYFTIYERTAKVDSKEIEYWLDKVSDLSKDYPSLFSDRIIKYMEDYI